MSNEKSKLAVIYTAVPGRIVAERLSFKLLESKLVCCVNMINGGSSLFWWEGKIESASEVYCVFKTKPELVDRVMAMIEDEHEYDKPLIFCCLPHKTNDSFLDYLGENLG